MHHFISREYNWEGIEFLAGIKDWKIFEKNNETITLNILQVPHNEIRISHAYKSECNRKRKNQVVLLMITDGEKWDYIALKSEPTDDGFIRLIKSLSKLFRRITQILIEIFVGLIVYIHLEQIMHLKNMSDYVKVKIIAL